MSIGSNDGTLGTTKRRRIQSLKQRIRNAFQDTQNPGGRKEDITSHRCDECDRVAADFAGLHWRRISVETLIYHHDSLSLFTPTAFVYYIPAFMLAALDYPDTDLPEWTSYSFTPGNAKNEERFLKRIQGFTPGQIKVIMAWLTQIDAVWPDNLADVQASWKERLQQARMARRNVQ